MAAEIILIVLPEVLTNVGLQNSPLFEARNPLVQLQHMGRRVVPAGACETGLGFGNAQHGAHSNMGVSENQGT